ncbi:hypothetical protein [Streptomyces sp. NPDC057381]|uniref:hypothetical protein n=1 Tax=Streptomyces sp. NPDC057381 TaxID=3346111 RepID=UPI003641F905
MRIDFAVPTEFEEMPLGMDFDTAWAAVTGRAVRDSLAGGRGQRSLTEMTHTLQRISSTLAEAGVVYTATCLHVFEGELSLGALAVAVIDFPYGDDALTATRGIVHGMLAARGSGWGGSVMEAPCGEVAVLTGMQNYVLPAVFSPSGEEAEVPVVQFHALVPVPPLQARPADRRMCLLAFSTPNPGHWEPCYAPMLAKTLRSVRFAEVGQGNRCGSEVVTG